MLYRILGIFVAMSLMLGGTTFQHVDRFGPRMVGFMLIMLGLALFVLIVWSSLEQNVNDKQAPRYDLEPITTNHTHPNSVEYDWQDIARARQEFIDLNTPDEHLIHPDDIKRQQASGHDSYPRLDIKD